MRDQAIVQNKSSLYSSNFIFRVRKEALNGLAPSLFNISSSLCLHKSPLYFLEFPFSSAQVPFAFLQDRIASEIESNREGDSVIIIQPLTKELRKEVAELENSWSLPNLGWTSWHRRNLE